MIILGCTMCATAYFHLHGTDSAPIWSLAVYALIGITSAKIPSGAFDRQTIAQPPI